ncbi:MAG: O-antigen ligase family protein [Victivallaceae bacterium]
MILFVTALLLVLIAFVVFWQNPRKGIMLLLVAMPVVATTWSVRFGGSSLIQLSYGGAVGVFLLHWQKLPEEYPAYWKICAGCILIANVSGLFFAPLYYGAGFMPLFSSALVAMNLFLGFYIFPAYFVTRSDFRNLLTALMISGIFPVAVGIYQAVTGVVWQERTIMGLVRYDGLYHDSVSCRIFIFPALFAAIISLLGNFSRGFRQRLFCLGIIIFSLIALYNLSSRAVFGIIALWVIGLMILGKRWMLGLFIFSMLVALNFYYDNFLFERVEFLLSKEIAISSGDMDEQYFLSGRGMLWQEHFDVFDDFGILAYLTGAGWLAPAHNEFMRVFFVSGILGLLFFGGSVLRLLWGAVSSLKSAKLPQVAAFLLLCSYFIDCIGVTPGLYPSYNWFLWGMLGLLLFKGEEFFRKSDEDDSNPCDQRTDSE